MTPEKLNHFQAKLMEEKALLEQQLQTIGRKNPENPADWEAVPTDMGERSADENDTADNIEEFESNTAILKQLEIRYNEIVRALEKIEAGRYGICEISGDPIEEDRLEANPAARTSKAHMGEEDTLS